MEVERPAAEAPDEEDEEGAAPSSEAGMEAALPATEELTEATLEGATPSTPTSRAGRKEGRALAWTPKHSQVEHSQVARRQRTQPHSKRPYWLPKFTSMACQAFREAGNERMLV